MRSLLFFLSITVAQAQFVPGRYIVELAEPPAVTQQMGAIKGSTERMAAVEDGRARVRAARANLRSALEDAGATVLGATEVVANTFSVQADDAAIAQIRSRPDVASIRRVRLYKRNLDRAVVLHGAPAVWNLLGPNRAGAGVKIAIIDTGIDNGHPGFQDSSLTVPDGYPRVNQTSDTRFTNSKVIVARSYVNLLPNRDPDLSARDRVGHGTALAMAAAGVSNTGPLATISGMAPKAFLGSYKVFGSPGSNDDASDDAILKAIDDAVSDGMDVINLSLGSLLAARPEDDVLVKALDRASSIGVVSAVAAGNDGPGPNTISSPATSGSVISVGASESDRVFESVVSVDAGASYPMRPAERSSDAGGVSAEVRDVAALDQSGLACADLPQQALRNQIALILRGDCTFESKLTNAQRAGAVAAIIYSSQDNPEAITMGVGAATLPAGMLSFGDGQQLRTAIDNGSVHTATVKFQPRAFPENAAAMADFSSAGPGPGASIRPDIVAVGSNLYTATQHTDPNGDMYSASGYIDVDGTSFSSPLVAGAVALLKSVHPGLSPGEYRSLLVNSAQLFPGNDDPAIQRAGGGRLDVDAASRMGLTAQPATLSFGIAGGGSSVSQEMVLHNVAATPESFEIRVTSLMGAAVPEPSQTAFTLDPDQGIRLSVALNVPMIAAGVSEGFVVIRRLSDGMITRIPYWSAANSSDPDSIEVLYSSSGERAGRDVPDVIFFRVLDKSGVALRDIQPSVTAVSGSASSTNVAFRDDEVADAYGVDARLGLGRNVFRIQAGGASKDVTIIGR